ncbi:MAG TPA: TetR/AcrR family transcriptional regulator [Solirubrobacteraceae bacterium]|nr:TetR/AcrR family transcriptional regulator [Solirubrobacteraceae bacterium]
MGKGERTRQRIVEAAIETLRTRGFQGASSRAIAEVGGFNPALTFYHFGSVHELLLSALEDASRGRLERYAPEARAAGSAGELLQLMRRIYREDLESGFIRVASEMVAGSVAHPELGPRVVDLMQPWIDLAEESFARVTKDTPLEHLVDPAELASGAVMFYLGANLLTQLVPERANVDRLLEAAERAAALADLLTGRG